MVFVREKLISTVLYPRRDRTRHGGRNGGHVHSLSFSSSTGGGLEHAVIRHDTTRPSKGRKSPVNTRKKKKALAGNLRKIRLHSGKKVKQSKATETPLRAARRAPCIKKKKWPKGSYCSPPTVRVKTTVEKTAIYKLFTNKQQPKKHAKPGQCLGSLRGGKKRKKERNITKTN